MTLISNISIQNFKCFRKRESFQLSKASFFIGKNNSGKSAVLIAFLCFFDDSKFEVAFINRTELRQRLKDYNKSSITLEFNLSEITTKGLKQRLTKTYDETLVITKSFTFREISQTTVIEYEINGDTFDYDHLDPNIRELLSKISVSYIHPQESEDLLIKAQQKLKRRLLTNWGRHADITKNLQELRKSWDTLRSTANTYLSSSLTLSLQTIWPGCSTEVALPQKVEDIISISDISLSMDKQPPVSLTHQGTGAQSTILYQTHYLLDSDKTIHRGFYYPIWLLEEPESFLHADIIIKLGSLLNSSEWLNNIQVLASTHSPVLLATSKKSENIATWSLMQDHALVKSKIAESWDASEIAEIGTLMGDSNFDIYFEISKNETLIIIEDSKDITFQCFKDSGIGVTNKANGMPDIKRHLLVLNSIKLPDKKFIFIVDGDKGVDDIKSFISDEKCIWTKNDFKIFNSEKNAYILVLPQNRASEFLFSEYDTHLEKVVELIFDDDFNLKSTIPLEYTRTVASIKGKRAFPLESLQKAKEFIQNEQEVKDIFWKSVKDNKYKIEEKFVKTINDGINKILQHQTS